MAWCKHGFCWVEVKPDVVFLKGGFVGVPIGVAAGLRGIPLVTHDSDALPGLANRMVSRWVTLHATALPPEKYKYPREKTKQVGVLVEHSYQIVTPEKMASFKRTVGLPNNVRAVLVTGGSSGATAINEAMKAIALITPGAAPRFTHFAPSREGQTKGF